MSMERVRLNGLQDRKLEANRNHSTPTKDSDISERARLYKGLAQEAAVASMALEGMRGGRGTQEMVEAQNAQLRGIRHDVVVEKFNLDLFDEVVRNRVKILKDKAEEERLTDEVTKVIRDRAGAISGDWGIINAELPGDFQPTLGDVPPNINFGNHAQPSFSEKDAFGFADKPVVRGW